MIQWEDRDNGDMVLGMTSGMQRVLPLKLGPVSQSMDGRRYRCRIAIDGSTIDILDTVTLKIEGEPTNNPQRYIVNSCKGKSRQLQHLCDS